MSGITKFKETYRNVRRRFGATRIQQLLRRCQSQGLDLPTAQALEVFGQSGLLHTRDYVNMVGKLEVWEIDPDLETPLRTNLPKATIVITDSFASVASERRTWDLIIVDNPFSTYAEHCEHFGLFPAIWERLAAPGFLIVNVIPRADEQSRRAYPYLMNPEQLAARSAFYATNEPADIDIETMLRTYRASAESSGRSVVWHTVISRGSMSYLALKVVTQPATVTDP